jgi:hypothetical protein
MLRVTKKDWYRLELWNLGANDATPEECKAYRLTERRKERDRKARDVERSRARRAATNPNYVAREDSIAAHAREMGITPNALRKRLRRLKWEARNGETALKEARFRPQKEAPSDCGRKRAANQPSANAQTALKQAVSDNAHVAEPHIFEARASTLDSTRKGEAAVSREIVIESQTQGKESAVTDADNRQGRAPDGRAAALPDVASEAGALAAVHLETADATITLSPPAFADADPRATSAPLAAHSLQDNQHCAAASLSGAKEELSAFRLTVEQDGCPPASSSLRAVLAAWGIAA